MDGNKNCINMSLYQEAKERNEEKFGNPNELSSKRSSVKVKRIASKGPTILGMGSRSAFPPTMPNQVLCKQNQRAHMEWQREQWMAQRERALKKGSKESLDANTAKASAKPCIKVAENQTGEMEKEVDDLLDWIGGIDANWEEVEEDI